MTGVNRYIGASIERVEDLRFLHGRGEYVADLVRDRLLYAGVLRSPVAHGRIRAIKPNPALAVEGVRAVITAAEIGAVPRIPLRNGQLLKLKFDRPDPVLGERRAVSQHDCDWFANGVADCRSPR